MLYTSAAYAIVRRLSVRLSVPLSVCLPRSCILSKWVNIFSLFFTQLVDPPLSFFHTERYGNISTWTPLTGASNASGVCKNRYSEPIADGSIACCERIDCMPIQFNTLTATDRGKFMTLVAGKRRRLFSTGRRSVYDKKPQRYAEVNRAAFNRTQCTWEIWSRSNNYKRLRSRYITLLKVTTETDTKHRAASLRQQSYLLSFYYGK